MLNLGPFKSFLLISYIGNNENPPITDKICWSLDARFCGASLYLMIHFPSSLSVSELAVGVSQRANQQVSGSMNTSGFSVFLNHSANMIIPLTKIMHCNINTYRFLQRSYLRYSVMTCQCCRHGFLNVV